MYTYKKQHGPFVRIYRTVIPYAVTCPKNVSNKIKQQECTDERRKLALVFLSANWESHSLDPVDETPLARSSFPNCLKTSAQQTGNFGTPKASSFPVCILLRSSAMLLDVATRENHTFICSSISSLTIFPKWIALQESKWQHE